MKRVLVVASLVLTAALSWLPLDASYRACRTTDAPVLVLVAIGLGGFLATWGVGILGAHWINRSTP